MDTPYLVNDAAEPPYFTEERCQIQDMPSTLVTLEYVDGDSADA